MCGKEAGLLAGAAAVAIPAAEAKGFNG